MVITIAHIIVSALLIAVVLLQMQGAGLSTTFGGGGEFYRSRRSMEKILVFLTIVFSILFGALSIVLLFPH